MVPYLIDAVASRDLLDRVTAQYTMSCNDINFLGSTFLDHVICCVQERLTSINNVILKSKNIRCHIKAGAIR